MGKKRSNDSIAASAARNEATADGSAGRVGDGRSVVMPTKKSAWTKEEDAVLREQVRLHGVQNWAAISEALALAGRRNPKSCRLRWCQHLSPAVDTAITAVDTTAA